MRSIKAMRPTRVPNGRAVLEAWAQTNRLRMKMVVKSKPGNNNAVCSSSVRRLYS